MTTRRLAADFAGLFAFVSPDPYARTAAATANIPATASTLLAFIVGLLCSILRPTLSGDVVEENLKTDSTLPLP